MDAAPPLYTAGLPALPPDALHCDWEWLLPAPPEALWPLVANTDRFNYDAGLPREVNTGGDRSAGVPLQGVAVSAAGLRLQVTQRPFEWVAPQWFEVYRVFDRGPLHTFRVRVELHPDPGGTRLRYRVWCGPRGAVGRWLLGLQLKSSRKTFDKVFREYGALAQQAGPTAQSQLAIAPSAPVEFAPGGRERLAREVGALGSGPDKPALVKRLSGVLERGDGFLACRVRPYELADAWGAGRRDVLELCLRATRAGLLDLRWDLLCPLCRGAKHTAASLSGVTSEAHCDACNIDYEVNFERQVELSFRANSAIRPAPDLLYCAGAPGLTPHIAVQLLLAPGEARTVQPQLAPGRYRLRLDNAGGGRYLRITEGTADSVAAASGSRPAAEMLSGGCFQQPDSAARMPPPQGSLEIALDPMHWPADEPELPVGTQLTLRNATDAPQLAMLERLAWTDDAVTAAEVTALQVFRDLFSSEALRPDQQISVGRVAVLFTDLVASTRLYREIGDAPAFGRVMEHFDILREEIAARGGAIVKTIGDAVLGVFTAPLPALRAMLAAQQRLAAADPPLRLKAGLHSGPCIAVTLNDRLDYFGTTVNFASRLAHAGDSVEVVISAAVHADPEVATWLGSRDAGVRCEPLQAALKGFEEESTQLWRVYLSRGEA